MKILNKTKSELFKFIKESLNSKAFNMLTFLESTQELTNIIGKDDTQDLLSNTPENKIKELHDKVFGAKNKHIEIPINDPVPDSVKSHVESQGDYITESGQVKLKSGRTVELSKYLPRSKAPKSVIDTHENWMKNRIDPATTKSKLVISRHPGEVASSTTRHSPWDSCADPEWEGSHTKAGAGPAWQAMPNELKHGTLIAMHVKHDAVPNKDGEYESKDVLGRSLVKHHIGDQFDESSFHQEGKDYGKFPEVARKAVDEFATKNYPMTSIAALKDPAIYNDDGKTTRTNMNMTDSDIDKHIDSGTLQTKMTLLEHPNLKEHHLMKLSNDKSSSVSRATLRHPNVTPKIIKNVLNKTFDISNPDTSVINKYASITAAKHYKADEDVIDRALDHPNTDTRIAAVKNMNVTKANLEKAMKDKNPDVRSEADAKTKNGEITNENSK